MANDNEERRTYKGSFLRTLHALERTLRNHIAELEALDCEDIDAAEAIIFAMQAAEQALANARAVRRGETSK